MSIPVACIITTYGRPDRVVDAVKSVIGQDYRPLEVIVVDDNMPESEDAHRTREVLGPLLSDCSGTLVSTGGRLGAPAARNLGAAETSSEFLAFLDDDDLWRPSKTTLQLSALMDAGDVTVFSYCNLDYIDDADRIVARKRIPPGRDPFRTHILKVLAPTSCLMVRREAFEAVGGFADIPAGQDYEFQLRLLDRFEVAWVDESLVDLRVHQGKRISSGLGKVDAARRLGEVKKKYYHRLKPKDRRFLDAESLANIGKLLIKAGELKPGRTNLWQSLKKEPWHLRRWAWLFLSIYRSLTSR